MSPGFVIEFSTNSTVHLTERNFQSYRKNCKHTPESQRLANPIRPHPHAATTQKTAEPVPSPQNNTKRVQENTFPFLTGIFYYKGTSFMNETKRCISKSKKPTYRQIRHKTEEGFLLMTPMKWFCSFLKSTGRELSWDFSW